MRQLSLQGHVLENGKKECLLVASQPSFELRALSPTHFLSIALFSSNISYFIEKLTMFTSIVLTAALVGAGVQAASSVSRPPESTIEPSLTQIIATQATQAALSPVSNVQGAGFNRFVQIWLENTVRA